MNLESYFNSTNGTGVFATADSNGEVNTAIFSRPHLSEDGKMMFIMGDNKTHANLQTNGHASFLFIEAGLGYKGRRFVLTKVSEDESDDLIRKLCRRCKEVDDPNVMKKRYVVYFNIDKELPLIGSG